MQLKCDYCGTTYDEHLSNCPNCGAINDKVNRSADGIPKTIAELQQFCKDKNLPLDKFRFFIGEDYRGAKAYGIYEENGIYTVYKNKSDGSRAIRYSGPDEEYAVNEIYQKLRSEVTNYKEFEAEKKIAEENKPKENKTKVTPTPRRTYSSVDNSSSLIKTLCLVIIFILISFLLICVIRHPQTTSPISSPNHSTESYNYNFGSFFDDQEYENNHSSSSSYSSSYYDDDDDDWGSSWSDSSWDNDDDDDWGSSWSDSSWDDDDDWDWDSSWDSGWDSDYSSDWDSDW